MVHKKKSIHKFMIQILNFSSKIFSMPNKSPIRDPRTKIQSSITGLPERNVYKEGFGS